MFWSVLTIGKPNGCHADAYWFINKILFIDYFLNKCIPGFIVITVRSVRNNFLHFCQKPKDRRVTAKFRKN